MRKMGPLGYADPLVTNGTPTCPGCTKPFEAGEYVTLVVIGPGDDVEARALRDQGGVYNAIAIPVHWDCSEQGPDR